MCVYVCVTVLIHLPAVRRPALPCLDPAEMQASLMGVLLQGPKQGWAGTSSGVLKAGRPMAYMYPLPKSTC